LRKQATAESAEAIALESKTPRKRLIDALKAAVKSKDADAVAATTAELEAFDDAMDVEQARRETQRLRELRDYPIFMYEAHKAGISGTGEPDQNELFPNDDRPPSINVTCLEAYREFQRDPTSTPHWTRRVVGAERFPHAFHVNYSELVRWDADS
jgi:type I restriction enzyme M protein